ncbi:hypothetical protein [Planotetraspora kaengkrachanensis]|uniref:DUF1877 family protein n=1 Tax=Planotetraspora kaengkrachanensis TaxID=575193 RepID=A0A8J3M5U8_9ACTN|nr:hypothetical protein [Planotetraspora kaengkrachanensis]GIG80004.1 hypothetical protein Pka01_31310 [Planotetraspora kaengkrachanensis]
MPETVLVACRRSVRELHRLCSFKLAPDGDHLDLDWAPSSLIQISELSGAAPHAVAALRRALRGDAEVNPAYRDHPDTIWEHPVTALDADAVGEVATVFRNLPNAVSALVPPEDHAAWSAPDKAPPGSDGPRGYLTMHLAALLRFYEEATRRGLAVVVWWD